MEGRLHLTHTELFVLLTRTLSIVSGFTANTVL